MAYTIYCKKILRYNEQATSHGLQAVKKIANRLGLSGFYGPLYELFEVDDIYAPSVEVIARSSLFHVVVDTDDTATKILDALNKERAGRVTFMPLNRLHPREMNLPSGSEVIPMLSKLRFESTYQKAFMQVMEIYIPMHAVFVSEVNVCLHDRSSEKQ